MRPLIYSLILAAISASLLGACGARGPLYMPNKALTNELPISRPVTTPAPDAARTTASSSAEGTSMTPEKK
ncbi:lipoprotein [Undibacterium jejuense]|uniref:Lipoprotein n=1 Tax=Undibacterium jejuense TaxID=1344949 RepID=A0A923HC60_9BURK|nr:lipoprotein [Undibacterium jejuense]MBC3861271.1 lipoprotein [Undibacterium jejuense]